mgnify:CR=1 FL=1
MRSSLSPHSNAGGLFTPDKSDNAPPELKGPLTQQLSRWGFIHHSQSQTAQSNVDIGHLEM